MWRNIFIEEEVNQSSTVFEAFYNKYFEGWTEEFQQYTDLMKDISKLIDNKEKEVGGYYPFKDDMFRALEITPLKKVKALLRL